MIAAPSWAYCQGLKATGRRLNAHLHELSGRSGTRLGALWTTLVVAQVGAAVAVLPAACYMACICGCSRSTARLRRGEIRGRGAGGARGGCCRRRQPCRPSAARDDVTTGSGARGRGSDLVLNPPGFASGARIRFEEGVAVTAPAPWDVSRMDVTLDMLDVYGAELAAGRRFVAGDVGAANTVLVNQSFAYWLAGDGNALGVRFRWCRNRGASSGERRVVRDCRDRSRFSEFSIGAQPRYARRRVSPGRGGRRQPAFMSVRFNAAMPAGFSSRLREIGAEIDPAMQLRSAMRLTDFYDQVMSIWRYISWHRTADADALLLSAADVRVDVVYGGAEGARSAFASRWAPARGVCSAAFRTCAASARARYRRRLTGIRPADLGRRAQPDARNGPAARRRSDYPAVGLLAALGQRRSLRIHVPTLRPTLSRWFGRPASSLAIRWHRSPIRRIGGVR